MRERPSSQYLTYRYPIWAECTLSEVVIASSVTLIICALLALLIGIISGHIKLAFLIMIPLLFVAPKWGLRYMAKIKRGKPHGYVMLRFRLWLEEHFKIKSPYIRRVGKWRAQRSLR